MSIYDKASLVLIPSGTKTSKVYSQKPTNGDGDFTFSRSTAATRVNASGNIEKETQNLARYSNDFSNSVWYKYTNTTYTLTTETITDPFGVSTSVYKVTLTGSGYLTLRQEFSGDTRYMTASAYIKKSSSGLNVALDQSDGNVENAAANTDWQRLSSSHASGYGFSFIDITITGVSGDYCYVSSAQMELGGAARDYIETTTTAIYGGITDNVPRLDYTDSSCPALLLEPQRSNNISQSEYHQGAIAAVTRTYNTADTLSPEGYYNAVKYEVNANNSDPYLRVFNIPTSGNDATFSLYVKGASGQLFSMILGRDGYNELAYEAFTLDGTWQRLTLSKTFTTTPTTLTIGAEFSHSSDDGVLGQEYYLYGLQCEAGSYATSYIPTYGSAVTRNEESGVLQNMIDNGVGSSGAYSVLVEVDIDENPSGSNSVILFLGQNQNLTDVEISLNSYEQQQSGRIRLTSATDGTITYLDSPNTRRYAFAVDGTSVISTDESGVTTDTLSVDGGSLGSIKMSYGTSNRTISMFKQLIIVPSALSSAELLAFTQS